jgi:hypothetical protein
MHHQYEGSRAMKNQWFYKDNQIHNGLRLDKETLCEKKNLPLIP